MVYICLANGFEEIEALAPADILRRAGVEVKLAARGGSATGSHGITVAADCDIADMDAENAELVVLPGGLPGAHNLFADPAVQALPKAAEKGVRIAAICAAPYILGRLGLLEGKKAVCYPGFEDELRGATVVKDAAVVTDGLITTGRGAGAALDFGFELAALLKGDETAAKLRAGMYAANVGAAGATIRI